jgi:hypothetical protein
MFFLMVCLGLVVGVSADEGMWPFNMIPKQMGVDEAWAIHVQRSCVRISTGGSGSFVSPTGLIMTNHHVAASMIYNLSSEGKDLIEGGFYAPEFGKELKCQNVYVDVLMSIENVTDLVNKNLLDTMTAGEREAARKTAINQIKQEWQAKTGLQPEMVTLYQGARYHLYLYKRYSDVRLVMAPEKNIAFFGGDEDNFEYPRYNLDVTFLRAYENGKPLETKDFLKWSESGPKLGEPLFVAGHPGKTQRQYTSSHLEFFKDVDLPLYLKVFGEKMKALEEFSARSPENERIAKQPLFSLSNGFKVLNGMQRGFAEGDIIQKKRKFEMSLYGDPNSFKPWVNLKTALQHEKADYPAYLILEKFNYTKLFTWARQLVRLAAEKSKPNEMRLSEYTDSEIPTLELSLFSTEPVYPGLEIANLTASLKLLEEILGKQHPAVKAALASKTPAERANDVINGTKLGDPSFRREMAAHLTETDPLIGLAVALDPYARESRKKKDDYLFGIMKESYAEIAKQVFKKFGETVYPDATFTLRLSKGVMKGYFENKKFVIPMTTFAALYATAEKKGKDPAFQLPSSWLKKSGLIRKSSAPFNFVSTNDIIGGNSGSPVFNAQREVVGLIFDGNIHSLVWDFEYDDTQGRAVSVHSQGILEALNHIYNAHELTHELVNSLKRGA